VPGDAARRLLEQSPVAAMEAFTAAWNNLLTALGNAPALTKFLNDMASALNWIGTGIGRGNAMQQQPGETREEHRQRIEGIIRQNGGWGWGAPQPGGVQPQSFVAPPSATGGAVQGVVYLDGRVVGQVVSAEMARQLSGPATAAGRFDSRRAMPLAEMVTA
jgi:hypothetical protein